MMACSNNFPGFKVNNFAFRVIQLNRLNWRDYLQEPNPAATALMAKMKIAPEDRPRVKAECLRLIVTLRLNPARMRLITRFVDTYLNLNEQEEERLALELDAIMPPEQKEEVMEMLTSWEQKEALRFVNRLLKRKTGDLTPKLQKRVEALSGPQMEALGEETLFMSSLAEVEAWLDRQNSGSPE